MHFPIHGEMGGEPYVLSEGVHLITDWRYIEAGKVLWLNEAGDVLPLIGNFQIDFARASQHRVPHGVALRAQPAAKQGPVGLRTEKHEFMIQGASTMLYVDGVYRMWYMASLDKLKSDERKRDQQNIHGHVGSTDSLCYAESDDGFLWRKPSLGICDFEGSSDNNIVFDSSLNEGVGCHGGSVFIDPSAPPEEKYKFIFLGHLSPDMFEAYKRRRPNDIPPLSLSRNRRLGIFGAVSADGIQWRMIDRPLMMQFSDTLNTAYYDASRQKYVGYFRMFHGGRRCVGYSETDDFSDWPLPRPILWPGADEEGPSNDYYTNSHIVYPAAPNTHFMFPAVYKRDTDTTELRLYSSIDGEYWSRVPGNPVVETGKPGSWDHGCLFGGSAMVPLGANHIALPYTGFEVPHKYPRTFPLGDMGYAVWRKDRICALEAREDGEFYLRPFFCKGRTLFLNAMTERAGSIKVEVCDLDGNPLRGRTMEDFAPLVGDHDSFPCSWGGSCDLGTAADEVVLLKFRMRAAALFAFELK